LLRSVANRQTHRQTCAGKTVRALYNACAIPERLGVITTRRYTNPRLPLPFTSTVYRTTVDEKKLIKF